MSAAGPGNPDPPRAHIRLVVVADVRLYREGLAEALGRFAHLTVAGVAGSATEAMQLILELVPDVAIVDISIAGGLALFRDVRASEAPAKLIAFGVDEDSAAIIRCAEAGAAGYVTVNASTEELAEAVERAAAGELQCGPRIAAELFRHLAERTEPRQVVPATGLTRREQQVLDLVTQGLSNKEIGAMLHIAEATVKNHVHHLLEKLKVTTRGQAAACAHGDLVRLRQGLLPGRALLARI